MVPEYDKIHNRFKLNKKTYSFKDLKEVAYSYVKEGSSFEKVIGNFLLNWLDDKDFILVQTSGSTGDPKEIKLSKQAMVYSAIATGDFFKLKPGDKALHCLPTNYIAGKMMLVRAMILGLELDLVEPKLQLVFDSDKKYDFCAMIPMQLQKTLLYCNNIKTIIVGGASVSKTIIDAIQKIKSDVYETYGMTETITHIALKKLNHFIEEHQKIHIDSFFKILPNVEIDQDSRNCLVIKAPNLLSEPIVTNDVVKLHSEKEFEWLGRYDNVINSGGVKLFPEQIEAKLSGTIQSRFFITKEPDNKLGECVVLVLESKSNRIDDIAFKDLERFEVPKKIYATQKFVETPNGKILRQESLQISN